MVIVYFGQGFLITYRSGLIFRSFSTAKVMQKNLAKNGCATFWAIFHKLIWSPLGNLGNLYLT
jgi:hypothetical protein